MKRMCGIIATMACALALAGCDDGGSSVAVEPAMVTVEPATVTLKTGQEIQLAAVSNVPDDVFTWTTDNQMIAQVDEEDGVAMGISPGQTAITATASVSGLSGVCLVTVLNQGVWPGPGVVGEPYLFTLDIGAEPGEGTWAWSGVGSYLERDPGESAWTGGGEAMGWNAGADGQWELDLPWPFAFDGTDYQSVLVNNSGQIIFGEVNDYLYISAFRTALSTAGEGLDIFVAQTEESVTIRWACAPEEPAGAPNPDGASINFEVVLQRDGEIEINYGVITSDVEPRIGISTAYMGSTSDLSRTALIPEGTSRVWTYDPGQTPPGLLISDEGVISGTPTEAGDFTIVAEYFVDGDRDFYGLYGFSVFEAP